LHTVRLDQFEGPLDLLLQLIEDEKLDITNVSLASVAEQYLLILRQNEQLPIDELADFLVIAARLLLLKSRLLLPNLDIEEEEGDLEQQLKLYKEFVEASRMINRIILKRRFTFVHDSPLKVVEPIFHPPKGLTADGLKRLMLEVVHKVEPLVSLPESVIERTMSLHDKIRSVQGILEKAKQTSFRELLSTATSRMEIIVTFLALLELVKSRHATLHQDNAFADVTIEPLATDV